MRIWIDVEDLFQYITGSKRPSGIQRLAFELQRAIRARGGVDSIRFLRHNLPADTFAEVPWEDVEALFHSLVDHVDPARPLAAPAVIERPMRSKLRRILYRLPVPLRIALIRCGRAQAAAIRGQRDALHGLGEVFRALFSGRTGGHQRKLTPFADVVVPGDVIAALGSPWFSARYAQMLRTAKLQHGVRVALLIYDLIPILHPQWCDRSQLLTFGRWLDACLPEGDIILAISRATAKDIERYAAKHKLILHRPVRVIPIGTGFGSQSPATDFAEPASLPEPGTYVLFVSTIEARKNHQLLFRVWRRLLDALPADQVPTLVFAGHVGWLVQDLLQQLRNAAWLDGKIVLVEDPSDADLERLYRGCLFTVFPSLYEGWGLPVSESLAFGKPCIISNATSLPEAGGTLARYFDPEDVLGATAMIREAITDRAALAAWAHRVVTEFTPVPWDESARAVMEELE